MMFSTVASSLVSLAQRARDNFPDHEPFAELCAKVESMDADELREAMENTLLPISSQLQKKNLQYFIDDPTFAHLELGKVDFASKPDALEEIWTVLSHSLLLQSTLSLLPPNMLEVAQGMATQLSGAMTGEGNIDQDVMGNILKQAMQAAGVYKQPIAQMDESTARTKLKAARRNLI